MLYPFTGSLHLLVAGFVLIIVGYSLLARKHPSSHLVRHWLLWFFFFFLYNALLALPSLLGNIFPAIHTITGFLFIAGILALGLGAWNGFVLGLSFLDIHPKTHTFYSRMYLVSLGFVLLLFWVFFENPRISEDGNWIFWHSNLSLTIAYSSLMTIAAWTVAYSFLKGLSQLQGWKMRLSTVCIGSGGVVFPLAAFFYFSGRIPMHITISFTIVLIGLFLLLLGNIAARHSRNA